jgi:Ni/Fe-hydrogenase 1 B-type cytochrome subunit
VLSAIVQLKKSPSISLAASVMTIQIISGLVIAGTDIDYPPLGQCFAESIAINKDNIAAITPYLKENIGAAAYKVMRDFRKPYCRELNPL